MYICSQISFMLHVCMFIDWLTIYQDHDEEMPIISKERFFVQDTITGEVKKDLQCPIQHEGSYSTKVVVRVSGNRVEVSGNPSRFNRLDNFEGYSQLSDCIQVYNQVLLSLGLPPFKQCTRVWFGSADTKGKFRTFSDGAVVKEVHLTSNQANGQGRAVTLIRALSTVPYNNSIPNLMADNNTVIWSSKRGKNRLLRPVVYNKGAEMDLHLLPAVKRLCGEHSKEYQYVSQLANYCHQNGITRHELNVKSEWLRRNNCRFWGLFDESKFKLLHDGFLAMQNKLQVNHLEVEDISDLLLRKNVCTSRQSSNATALVYMRWMHGTKFDLNKRQIKTHRARLRTIGVDIALPCDLSKFATVHVISSNEVISTPAKAPDFYKHPVNPVSLKLVA